MKRSAVAFWVLLAISVCMGAPSVAEEPAPPAEEPVPVVEEPKPEIQFVVEWEAPEVYTAKRADVLRGLLGVREQVVEPAKPRPWIGVNVAEVEGKIEDLGGNPGEAGARLSMIVADAPAQEAGLQKDDVVIALNDKPIPAEGNPIQNFIQAIQQHAPGDAVTLTILRDKKRIQKKLTLGTFRHTLMPEENHPEVAIRADEPNTLLEKTLDTTRLSQNYLNVRQMFRNASNIVWNPDKIAKGAINPFRLKKFTAAYRHPGTAGEICQQVIEQMQEAFNDKITSPADLILRAAANLDVTLDPQANPVHGNNPKERLVHALKIAYALREKAFAKLTAEERKWIEDQGHTLYLGRTDEEKEKLSDLQIFQAAYKIDYNALFAAGFVIARELEPDRVQELIKHVGKQKRRRLLRKDAEQFGGDVIRVEHTPFGKLVIGGPGATWYKGDAAIVIDLGGDDLYANPAGASVPGGPRFSITIDASGNDLYHAGGSAQGSGFAGAGFLLDLVGNDVYRANNQSQGTGVFGIGMLLDMAGDDTYRAEQLTQGAGLFGIGILADHAGNDIYHVAAYGQGFGGVKGFGAILEVDGQDAYYAGGKIADERREKNRSFVSFAQGAGLGYRDDEGGVHASGGIGLIADAAGHDQYISDHFAQGTAYWFSMGILSDDAGGDNYYSGRYAQGAGIHHGVAAILDHAGNDHYTAYFGVSQACGHDIAVGIIADDAGNDKYTGGVICQGAGNDNGIGILIDRDGSDEYNARSPDYSVARGGHNKTRNYGSFGLILDLGGAEDVYGDPILTNNTVSTKTEWGILIDR